MAWTNVAKPTDSTYSYVNTQGKQTYDQSDLLFDDPSVFYDSVNQSAYTNVAKPTGGTTKTISAGMATGLLTPPTYATAHTVIAGDPYTYVYKPTT